MFELKIKKLNYCKETEKQPTKVSDIIYESNKSKKKIDRFSIDLIEKLIRGIFI